MPAEDDVHDCRDPRRRRQILRRARHRQAGHAIARLGVRLPRRRDERRDRRTGVLPDEVEQQARIGVAARCAGIARVAARVVDARVVGEIGGLAVEDADVVEPDAEARADTRTRRPLMPRRRRAGGAAVLLRIRFGGGPDHVAAVAGAVDPHRAHVALQLPLGDQERVHAELLPEMEDRLPLADERAPGIDRGDQALDARGVGGAEAEVVDRYRVIASSPPDRLAVLA